MEDLLVLSACFMDIAFKPVAVPCTGMKLIMTVAKSLRWKDKYQSWQRYTHVSYR